ncbi:MAG: hypothetical protein JXL97_12340 [Bacteroidales bacterium]|nr:hypothetical protein [Bacteroidales bacterium]
MRRLIEISKEADVFPKFKNTPIGDLLEYHNLNKKYIEYDKAEILIGMCMDYRLKIKHPDKFAFVIRTGGANLRYSEFNVSYAISVGKINYIAIIGHNNCAMVNLPDRKELFTEGLVEGGWDKFYAENHFFSLSPMHEISNEIDFTISEVQRLRNRYPNVCVAPLLYNVDNHKLYQIEE